MMGRNTQNKQETSNAPHNKYVRGHSYHQPTNETVSTDLYPVKRKIDGEVQETVESTTRAGLLKEIDEFDESHQLASSSDGLRAARSWYSQLIDTKDEAEPDYVVEEHVEGVGYRVVSDSRSTVRTPSSISKRKRSVAPRGSKVRTKSSPHLGLLEKNGASRVETNRESVNSVSQNKDLKKSKMALQRQVTAPRRLIVASNSLLNIVKSLTVGTVGTSNEGMYGENRISCLVALCDLLTEHFLMDKESIFVDIGSGRGIPNIVAAVYAGVKSSVGIELDNDVYHSSLDLFLSLMWHSFCEEATKSGNIVDKLPPWGAAFISGDATLFDTLSPATHIYSFDLAMPQYMVWRFVKLFNESETAFVMISFRKDLKSMFSIEAEHLATVSMDMTGSGERHGSFIYVKRSHLHRLPSSVLRVMTQKSPGIVEHCKPDSPNSESRITSDDVVWRNYVNEMTALTSWEGMKVRSSLLCKTCEKLKDVPLQFLSSKDTECLNADPLKIPSPAPNSCAGSKNIRESSSSGALPKTQKKKDVKQEVGNRISDRRNANTNKPQSAVLKVEKWVHCDICQKWRRLPGCTEEEFAQVESQQGWECSMNRWDWNRNSCDTAEECDTQKSQSSPSSETGNDESSPKVYFDPSEKLLVPKSKVALIQKQLPPAILGSLQIEIIGRKSELDCARKLGFPEPAMAFGRNPYANKFLCVERIPVMQKAVDRSLLPMIAQLNMAQEECLSWLWTRPRRNDSNRLYRKACQSNRNDLMSQALLKCMKALDLKEAQYRRKGLICLCKAS
eukprot:Lankesteria_metandrocarpae@DN2484_c0_g1_i1.p1